jgi:fatty-acyl-CoA synthase
MSADGLALPIVTARQHAIGDLLRRRALRHPAKLAIVHDELRQTFAEMDDTVNRTANALAARGVAKGDRVAILSHNSHAFVVAYFALAKLGALSVPINFMLRSHEVAFILEHSGATGMLVEPALAGVADDALTGSDTGGAVSLRGSFGPVGAGWEDVTDWMTHPDAREPAVAIGDDDPLQLLYTSGTESRPKGAMLTSRNLIAQYVTCAVDG